jgi:HK97 family phage prohead protease
MSKKITRCYNMSLEAREAEDEGKGIVEGMAIVYNSKTDIGWFDEIIEQDALAHTDMKDVRMLVNHDTSMIPLARSRNNTANSTLQLIPELNGLKIRAKLDIENNADAKSLYSAIQRGDISGMSFMFEVDGEAWEDEMSDHPLRRITSIAKIYEVSAVTFPAYEQTEINARSKEELESYRSSLESERKAQPLDSDKAGDDIETKKREEREALELAKLKAKITGGI